MPKKNKYYGIEFPDSVDEFQRELFLYARDDVRERYPDTMQKHEHLKKAMQIVFPPDKLVFHKWLDRAIEAWCYEPIVSEWGASSMGKSSDYGLLTLMDVLADPFRTLAVMVTNPMAAHDKRSFKYARYYHSLLPEKYQILKEQKQNPKGLIVDYEKLAKHGHKLPLKQTGIICISNKAGDSSEDMLRHIGGHELNMILVVDEPQGCSETVLDLKINMAAGAKVNYKERFLGNPRLPMDPLGKHSQPVDETTIGDDDPKPADWKLTETADSWRTMRTHKGRHGICFVRDGERSPGIEDPDKYHFLFGADNLADAAANAGRDSAEYWTYAKGRMLIGQTGNIALAAVDLESLGCFRSVQWLDDWTDYTGLDPAPQGTDKNILYRVRVGREAPAAEPETDGSTVNIDTGGAHHGRQIVQLIEKVAINVNVSRPDKTGQICDAVHRKLKQWDIPLERLAVDVTGNQAPIADRLEKDQGHVYRVQAGGRCSSHLPIYAGSSEIRRDRYFSRSTELFFNAVQLCRHKQLVLAAPGGIADTDLIHQLTTRQLEMDGEKLRGFLAIEKKELWRARNGGDSPDDLDAVLQTLAQIIEQGVIQINANATDNRNHAAQRRRQLYGQQPGMAGMRGHSRRMGAARGY